MCAELRTSASAGKAVCEECERRVSAVSAGGVDQALEEHLSSQPASLAQLRCWSQSRPWGQQSGDVKTSEAPDEPACTLAHALGKAPIARAVNATMTARTIFIVPRNIHRLTLRSSDRAVRLALWLDCDAMA